MPHKIQIMEPGREFRNVGIWIGWLISVLAMIIRVDMISTHMVIVVLKVIYRGLGLTFGQHSSADYSSTGEYSTSSTEYLSLIHI